VYLAGVIPGPSKPSTEQINHFLALIVDELLEFWDPGVSYSQTARAPFGRLVRLALIPVICDLPAARQVAGLASYNHSYALCSCCTLEQDEVERTDVDKFPLRSMKAHREAALAWLHAESSAKREELCRSNGIRYSELLRLPYWNPVLYVVIDSMHNLYLGIIQRHIRDFWGVNTDVSDGDALWNNSVKAPARPSARVMDYGVDQLLYGSNSNLEECGKAVLFHLCVDRGIRRAGTISILMKNLKEWRRKEHLPKPRPPGSKPVKKTPPSARQPDLDRFANVDPVAYESSERLLKTTKSFKYFVEKTRKDVLQKMCAVRGLSTDGVRRATDSSDVGNSVRIPGALQGIGEQVVAEGSGMEQQATNPPIDVDVTVDADGTTHAAHKPPRFQGTAALGNETMREYVRDRVRIELPRWVNAAPVGFGTAKRGKLSADQWRTVAVIHLPITLIRTWGTESGRRFEMLQNFLGMVDAVETVGLLEIDELEVAHAQAELVKYLEGVKVLYKGAKFRPIHHHSLHLGLFLRLFGPVHSWRAFAFERMNYTLQSVNTNLRFGDLEMTMMMSSCRNANLKPLLSSPSVRSAMPIFVHELERLSTEDRRGMRLDAARRLLPELLQQQSQTSKDKSVDLDEATFLALLRRLNHESTSIRYVADWADTEVNAQLLSREARMTSKLDISGVFYKPRPVAAGDSNVIFVHPTDGRRCAGHIERIFHHCRLSADGTTIDDTYLVAKPLMELAPEEVVHDPYRRFGRVGGWLCYAECEIETILLRPDDILCHFAKTMLGELRLTGKWLCVVEGDDTKGREYVHVRPLDRVSCHYF
ncbi:hypothetical protein FKP32DRAFT_1542724, partial [Trametes sanguinea]